jgi:hypothetical protein
MCSYGILLWELFHGMLVWTKEPNPKGSGFTVGMQATQHLTWLPCI